MHKVWTVCFAWLLLTGSMLGFASQEVEAEGVVAAEAWLALVDSGEYEKSWDAASTFFQRAATVDHWVTSLEAFRKPLGDLVTRTLKSAEYKTSLPGAPDGEYVVIQFETTFESKQNAVETVTPMKGADGIWRVGGYFIR